MPPEASGRQTVAVIGGGPAGLMAAETLAEAGMTVELFDAMPTLARKFLIAGRGGLNLTHSESPDRFLGRYGDRREHVAPWLSEFGPDELREWSHGLGIATFDGSPGRVLPDGMKAAPLLRAWLHRLRRSGVRIHVRHRWAGWSDESRALHFATPSGAVVHRADSVILALGGGSWPQLGSDGTWVGHLEPLGVKVIPLRPANCGFDIAWSSPIRERFAGQPVKNLRAWHISDEGTRTEHNGECMITANGIEGGLIYALSSRLRTEIESHGSALLHLDLAPAWSEEKLLRALEHPRGRDSLANHLRRRAGIEGAKAALLRECAAPADLADPSRAARLIKDLPLRLVATRPLVEAISSAGGVSFDALDKALMLHTRPGVFCAGEMLDWEAPTGGYLLTACMSGGRFAARGALRWLACQPDSDTQ